MSADLLDFPDVGAGAGGGGDEARPQAVTGILRRIEPGRGGARLDDAGDGVVGQAGVAQASAFPQRPEYGSLGDAAEVQPGAQVEQGGQPAPFRHGDDGADAFLVGFGAPDGHPQAFVLPG